MNIMTANGIALHWQTDGAADGPAIVFGNSLGTDFRLWDPLLAHLPSNYRYIRYDMRGHGLSDTPAGPYTIDDLSDDVVALLDGLGIETCVYVGLSIGGLLAQRLAHRFPERITAMVLSNTAAKIGTAEIWQERMQAIEDNGLESMADAILERWFAPSYRTDNAMHGWRNMVTRTPKAGYLGCCAAIRDANLTDVTRTLTLPTLGIGGSVDGSTPEAIVAATLALIEGSTFHTIDNTAHLPCVENPEAYASLLRPFLQQVLSRT